ncbi:hypothetical protein pipiens_015666 [Culex pipiens pipiens]|uniref:Uncharacterized protein n=1 Tax=Culex pipiens pipiens TaxID=38569 RepID=A0ABD1CPH3_CULPP
MVPKVPFHSALAVQLGEEVLTRLEELTGEVCWTAFGFSTDGTGKCRNADRRFVMHSDMANDCSNTADEMALRVSSPNSLGGSSPAGVTGGTFGVPALPPLPTTTGF